MRAYPEITSTSHLQIYR